MFTGKFYADIPYLNDVHQTPDRNFSRYIFKKKSLTYSFRK